MNRRLFLLVFSCIALSCENTSQPFQHSPLPVIPEPVSAVLLKDSFSLTANTMIMVDNDPQAQAIGNWLQLFLERSTGYKNQIAANRRDSGQGISLSINKQFDKALGDEGYKLSIHTHNISITANKYAGLFYGLQTLLQLLPAEIESKTVNYRKAWRIPCAEVTDHPRFQWRGLMLDVSRHFFSVAEVKQLLNEMARYKFNILHFHLTDDNGWRLEIKSLPELTKTGAWRVARTGWWGVMQPPQEGEAATYGGFYTQDDIKELVAYAASLAINIVPEIDVPGHSLAAIAAYKNLSCTRQHYNVNPGSDFYGKEDNALCAGNDSTYEFLEKVFTEVAALFPYPYIHVGGDECFRGYWHNCETCKKKMQTWQLKDEAGLQNYFLKRLQGIITSKGKKIIGWDEILDGGSSTNTTVMSWRGAATAKTAIAQHHPVIMAPREFAYLDLYQGDPAVEKPSFGMLRLNKVYEFEPVPEDIDEQLIMGGQGCLWTEFIPDISHAEYMLWPRAFALAEILWTPEGRKDWPGFLKRTQYHLMRLKAGNINYSLSVYDPVINVSKSKTGTIQISMNTEIDSLTIHYTFDDTDPVPGSATYRKGEILALPDKAVFFRAATYNGSLPAGKTVVLPLYELKRRAEIN